MSIVVFRCDVGAMVGAGHLVRCRQLAASIRSLGAGCVMVGPSADFATDADRQLFDAWVPQTEWASPASDAEAFRRVAAAHGADVAVLDDYRVDENYQAVLLDRGFRWMQQFDASRPQRYWADMVVNASPYETIELHAHELKKPGAHGLFGPRYAILRPQFPVVRSRPAGDEVQRILVTFGGGDDHGHVISTLAALIEAVDTSITFVVVSGHGNARNGSIAEWIENGRQSRVELHINPPDVASVYASCDLAVLAAGTTGHELASCGVPMIMIALADNQVRQGIGWQNVGAAVFLGPAGEAGPDQIASAARELSLDGARRSRMAEIGPRLVDGHGARRLAECLLNGRVQ